MKSISRRKFLTGAGAVGVVPALVPEFVPSAIAFSSDTGEHPKVLNYAQWQTVEAMTARLIPTDDEPGAVEANCVNFIDKALAKEEKQSASLYLYALDELARIVELRYKKSFNQLSLEQKDALLQQMQTDQVEGWQEKNVTSAVFFATLLAHTIMGFLGDPKYGGNRNHVGWQVAGFPGHVHMLGGATKEHMQGRKKIRSAWGKEV